MFFKFENFWLNYVGHHSVINEAWGLSLHGNPIQVFTHLLSRSRFKLNAWSRSGLCSIDSALARIGLDISALEYLDLFSKSHPLLLEHYSKLAALQCQCSTKWAQRAHLAWIMDGDQNSKKFQNLVRNHSHNKFISQVVDLEGRAFYEQLDIVQAFQYFYSRLWTTPTSTNTNLLDILPIYLPAIFDHDSHTLIREVTKEEVYKVVLELPAGKSLGPDGFNAELFREF